MLIFLVILLLVLLTGSIVVNILLLKAGERQLAINELYERWISDWRLQVFKTWSHMKTLDEKEIFSRDDEVGVVFQDMKELIDDLNNRIEETTEEE